MKSNEQKPQFALCTISHREKLLEYALEVAKDLGCDGVEIWGREPHISERFDENRVYAARKMVEERGLTTVVFGSYLTLGAVQTRPEDRVRLDDVLHTARCLHTPLMRVWASDMASDRADASIWSRTVAEIREACDRAERLNIVLAAEMHDDTLADTGESSRRLVELVNRDSFRLTFQVSIRPRKESPEERLQWIHEFVVHLHVQNFYSLAAKEDEPLRRAPVSEGLIDYYPLLEMLYDNGYSGSYALEFAACEGEGKREALAEDLRYLKSLFKLIGKQA